MPMANIVSKPDVYKRQTDNNRIVDIAGDAHLIGQFVNVKITDVSNPKRLRGEIIHG